MVRYTTATGVIEFDDPEMTERILRNQQDADAQAKERVLMLATVYRVDGQPDPDVPFGGLLTRRLQLSESSVRTLITTGQLAYFCGGKKAYRVTEGDVVDYIERTKTRAA